MGEIAREIELYHRLSTACLALSILFLFVAVVLFFILDIRKVLGFLTGSQAKKQIRMLESAARSPKEKRAGGGRRRQEASQGLEEAEKAGALETDSIGREQARPPERPTAVLEHGPESHGSFVIERELILVHSQEMI